MCRDGLIGQTPGWKERACQFRMAITVVALAIIFHHKFPVALLKDVLLIGNFGFGQFMRGNVGLKDGRSSMRIIRKQINEENKNESGNIAALRFLERKALLVEINFD